MTKKSSPLEQLFFGEEQTVFKPFLAGLLIGIAFSYYKEGDLAIALVVGVGFGILWSIAWKVNRVIHKE